MMTYYTHIPWIDSLYYASVPTIAASGNKRLSHFLPISTAYGQHPYASRIVQSFSYHETAVNADNSLHHFLRVHTFTMVYDALVQRGGFVGGCLASVIPDLLTSPIQALGLFFPISSSVLLATTIYRYTSTLGSSDQIGG